MPDDHRGSSTRVLVVDDQPAFARSLQVVLEAQSAVEWVATAHTGEACLEFAAEHRPDVVVMDIDLPGISGIEATRRLVEQDPDLSVVVITGSPDPMAVTEAASAGAQAFLLKDSSLVEILDAVLARVDRLGPASG